MMDDAIEFLELRERVAKSGRTYFNGTLNGCPVVLLKDEHAEVEDGVEAIWTLFMKPTVERRWKKRTEGRSASHAVTAAPAAPRARRPSTGSAQDKAARAINERLSHVGLNDPIDL